MEVGWKFILSAIFHLKSQEFVVNGQGLLRKFELEYMGGT